MPLPPLSIMESWTISFEHILGERTKKRSQKQGCVSKFELVIVF